jgi:uncharacterized protein (DUF983 family)
MSGAGSLHTSATAMPAALVALVWGAIACYLVLVVLFAWNASPFSQVLADAPPSFNPALYPY